MPPTVTVPDGWADASFARPRASLAWRGAGAVLAAAGLCLAAYGAARGFGIAVALAVVPIGIGGGLVARGVRLRPRVRIRPELLPPNARFARGWRLRFESEDRFGWRMLSCVGRLVACGGVVIVILAHPRPLIRFFGGFGTAQVVAYLVTWAVGGIAVFSFIALVYWGSQWLAPRQRLTIGTDGVTVGRGTRTVHLGWDHVAGVSPYVTSTARLLRRSRPERRRAVTLTFAPSAPEMDDVSPMEAGVISRSAILGEPPAAVVAVEDLRQHPAVVLAALDHFHRHPEERERLADHTWPAAPG